MSFAEKMQKLRAKGLVFHNIDIIKKFLKTEYDDMKKESGDRVTVIAGYEGTGKSYFAMDIHDFWYTNVLKGKKDDVMKSNFCFTDLDWAKALVQSKDKKLAMITHDEAINILYRKEGATKKNKSINKGFKKFRGKKWYHLLLIPQIHRLDKEMVEDRVRSLFFITTYKGERYAAFYPKELLDSLIAEISRMIDSTAKDVKSRPQVFNCATDPAIICKIPLYEGKLLDEYGDSKEGNMDESVDEIEEAVKGKLEKQVKAVPKNFIKDKAFQLLAKGRTQKDVAETLDIGVSTLQKWVYEHRDSQKA